MNKNEIKVGENIGSRKCSAAFRGHLHTEDGKGTAFNVYSVGKGIFQLASVEEWTGRVTYVSAPLPSRCICRAGGMPWFGGGFLQYWKPVA
jgi:hypothetical protein